MRDKEADAGMWPWRGSEALRAASCVSRSPEGREELGEEAEGGAEGPAPRPRAWT